MSVTMCTGSMHHTPRLRPKACVAAAWLRDCACAFALRRMVALRHAARRCASAAAGAPFAWRTAALEGRSVLRLEGADVFTYLQARPFRSGRTPRRVASSAGRVLRLPPPAAAEPPRRAGAGDQRRAAAAARPRRRVRWAKARALNAQTLTRSAAAPGATPPPLYTALLSSAGRVLYDAFLHAAPPGAGGEPALLADVPSEAASQARPARSHARSAPV